MIEHKTVSLADQVFEQLETDILCGKYQRGDILTEAKLSAELVVSRTPIREALRRLSQEHLIEDGSKGSVVVGIGEKDLTDIYTVRTQIEPLAAMAAAKCRTDEDLQVLKETLDLQEFYLKKQDADRIKAMDSKFHETLYKMSGSTVFYDVLTPLHKKVQKYRRVSVSNTGRAEASVKEHTAIYEAIANGDGDKAALLMKEHVGNAYTNILKRG